MSTDEPILHFGLGQFMQVDRLEVEWPSGVSQVFEDLEANKRYEIAERRELTKLPEARSLYPLFVESKIELPSVAERKEGYFSDYRRQALLPFPQSRLGGAVALGDLNGDTLLDIVLGGASGQETQVLLNGGTGAFRSAPSLDFEADFGSEDWDIELVDWEGDGDEDLLIASGGVEVGDGDAFFQDRLYLNEGDGLFFREWELPFASEASSTRSLIADDFNGDGTLDLFAAGLTIPDKYPYAPESQLWLSNEGKLAKAQTKLAENQPIERISDVLWVDLDGDGRKELLVSKEWGQIEKYQFEENSFRHVSRIETELSRSGLWTRLEVADLDGDGRLDILAGNLGLNSEYRATTEESMRIWYSQNKGRSVELIESFVRAGEEWPLEVKWRLENEFPREIRKIPSFEKYASMTLDEVFPNLREEGYRYLECNELRSGVFWQLEDGAFEFEALPSYAQTGKVMNTLIRDFDDDGRQDILLSLEPVCPEPWSGRFEPGHISLLLNQGGRSFEAVLPWQSGLSLEGSPRGLAWGDLDGDSVEELIVTNTEGMPIVFARARRN